MTFRYFFRLRRERRQKKDYANSDTFISIPYFIEIGDLSAADSSAKVANAMQKGQMLQEVEHLVQ